MKKLLLSIILLPALAIAQPYVSWDPVIVVNDSASLGFTRPIITLSANNVPVVMWGKKTNKQVYTSRFNGTSFDSPVLITPGTVTAYVQNWTGPDMHSAGDTVFVTFKSQPDNTGLIYVVKSTDGGITFGDTVRVSDQNWSKFPSIEVRPNGEPVVAFMNHHPNWADPKYHVATSNDGGATFGPDVDGTAGAPGEACDCCPSYVIAEEDRTILLFRNNDADLRDIWSTLSTDTAQSFPTGGDIDENNWVIGACPSTGPNALTDGDSLIYTWRSGASGYSRINIGKSNIVDNGIGFNAEINSNSTANQNYPKIAGDGQLLGLVWQEAAVGNMDIKFNWSYDGIRALVDSNAVVVNQSIPGSQRNPDMVYADGYFHVVWSDDNTSQVMYRRGQVFTHNISSASEDSKLDVYPNPVQDILSIDLESDEIKAVAIYNVEGKLVLSGGSANKIDLSSLASGTYTLSVETKLGSIMQRQLIKN